MSSRWLIAAVVAPAIAVAQPHATLRIAHDPAPPTITLLPRDVHLRPVEHRFEDEFDAIVLTAFARIRALLHKSISRGVAGYLSVETLFDRRSYVIGIKFAPSP